MAWHRREDDSQRSRRALTKPREPVRFSPAGIAGGEILPLPTSEEDGTELLCLPSDDKIPGAPLPSRWRD